MSHKLLYIHGFNSTYDPNAAKIKSLQNGGFEVIGMTYDTYSPYHYNIRFIKDSILEEIDAVVGTSLGGFYALQLIRHLGVPAVAINPCYDPKNMLKRHVGHEYRNYHTAQVATLTQDVLDSYPEFDMDYGKKYRPLILLDYGDEIIDSHKTERIFENFPMHVFEGGNHQFAHMDESVEIIDKYINQCIDVSYARCE